MFAQNTEISSVKAIPPEVSVSQPKPFSSDALVDSSANMWAVNFIPQYGGREDFPSIPMQIAPYPEAAMFDYGVDVEPNAGTAQPVTAEGQSFWQIPPGFEYVTSTARLLFKESKLTRHV